MFWLSVAIAREPNVNSIQYETIWSDKQKLLQSVTTQDNKNTCTRHQVKIHANCMRDWFKPENKTIVMKPVLMRRLIDSTDTANRCRHNSKYEID